jgi:hypothetical protein
MALEIQLSDPAEAREWSLVAHLMGENGVRYLYQVVLGSSSCFPTLIEPLPAP